MKKALIISAIVIGSIAVIILALGFLGKPEYRVERKMVIKAPKNVVFEQISKFKNWEAWSPWKAMDSTMQITYNGNDGEVGSSYTWVGKISGEGTVSCASLQPNKEFNFNLDFSKPFESHPKGSFNLNDAPGGTELAWTMEGKNGFVEKVFSWFMDMDKMVGTQFESGLSSIKEIAESESVSVSSVHLEVVEVNMPAAVYVVLRKKVLWIQ